LVPLTKKNFLKNKVYIEFELHNFNNPARTNVDRKRMCFTTPNDQTLKKKTYHNLIELTPLSNRYNDKLAQNWISVNRKKVCFASPNDRVLKKKTYRNRIELTPLSNRYNDKIDQVLIGKRWVSCLQTVKRWLHEALGEENLSQPHIIIFSFE
jgi:hypothetical protein